MKKKIALLLAGTLAIGMLAGCGGGKKEETKKTSDTTKAPTEETTTGSADYSGQTLKFAGLDGGYGTAGWNAVIDAFKAKFPGVKVEVTLEKELEEVIRPQMQAGEYPDVVYLSTGRDAGMVETLTKGKKLEKLDDVLDKTVPGENVKVKDKITDGFIGNNITNPYVGDGTYLMPMFYSPCGLFYNEAVFTEKNWKVPETWDEMWELAEKAKADGISLFTYPTVGYFDAFLYSLINEAGGQELFNKAMAYDTSAWESAEMQKVFDVIKKLSDYIEPSTVSNANETNYKQNQQLVLNNKALFMPNGTWIVEEMKDAPRADGFKWGMMPLPSLEKGGDRYSYSFIEQIWIPKEAENKDLAKEFIAYLYSDEAGKLFAENGGAVQPIAGVVNSLSGDDVKMFYSIYENGAKGAMGQFYSTEAVEGVVIKDVVFKTVDSIMSKSKTTDDWKKEIIKACGKLVNKIQ